MIRFDSFAILSVLATGCVAEVDGTSYDPHGSGTSETGSGDDSDSSGSEEDGTSQGSGTTALAATTWKVLDHDYQAQQTGYWCGPAASRIALSTRMTGPTQQTLANQLGTDSEGTDHIGLVTGVVNNYLGARYANVLMPNDPPTPGQREQLWQDVMLSIDAGHGMVANIVAPANNHPPGYPNYTIYHYIALVGYNPETRQVYVADSANFQNNHHYWLSLDQLSTLIPPKGYSTYRCGVGRTQGLIDDRYNSLGGCGGWLGAALTNETATPDGKGRFNVFRNGSIYWSPQTGAYEVHGAIRDRYRDFGWEAGTLGYPLSNETKTPDGIGRFSVFQGGSIYWTPQTGAHDVRGAIRDKWAETGWEAGALGYPTSDEYPVPNGRRSDFQRGSITWDLTTKTTTVEQK